MSRQREQNLRSRNDSITDNDNRSLKSSRIETNCSVGVQVTVKVRVQIRWDQVRSRVTVRFYRGEVHLNVKWCCTLQGRAVQRDACRTVQFGAVHSREVELSTRKCNQFVTCRRHLKPSHEIGYAWCCTIISSIHVNIKLNDSIR
jgi:hypothetical protein